MTAASGTARNPGDTPDMGTDQTSNTRKPPGSRFRLATASGFMAGHFKDASGAPTAPGLTRRDGCQPGSGTVLTGWTRAGNCVGRR